MRKLTVCVPPAARVEAGVMLRLATSAVVTSKVEKVLELQTPVNSTVTVTSSVTFVTVMPPLSVIKWLYVMSDTYDSVLVVLLSAVLVTASVGLSSTAPKPDASLIVKVAVLPVLTSIE